MNAGPDLLARLDAIARSLRDSGQAIALIALGSVGRETARLDAWSDLDFFAVVEPGAKARFIDRLDWLAAARPLVWSYRNTVDGHQALMDDGVFCEFAVHRTASGPPSGAPRGHPSRSCCRRQEESATFATH